MCLPLRPFVHFDKGHLMNATLLAAAYSDLGMSLDYFRALGFQVFTRSPTSSEFHFDIFAAGLRRLSRPPKRLRHVALRENLKSVNSRQR